MIAGDPPQLKDGDELTLGWLNAVLALVLRCRIRLGDNSGLRKVESDHGTFLAAISGTDEGDFYCNPTTPPAAATGTWAAGGAPSSVTPGTTTSDVYQDQNGTLVKVATGATIQNWHGDPFVSGIPIQVKPNGYGMWNCVQQGCTALA
jgi:hypothetical protein